VADRQRKCRIAALRFTYQKRTIHDIKSERVALGDWSVESVLIRSPPFDFAQGRLRTRGTQGKAGIARGTIANEHS